MKETKIDVKILKNGEVKIEASGFTDSTCLKETLALQDSLGVTTKQTKKTEAARTTSTARKVKA